MSKLKKIVLSIIITLLGIIGISTLSSAYYVGQSISVSYTEYLNNSNIYCVEHGQALRAINYYKIISQVNIRGKTSTDHTGKQITHNDNAKLAYILSGDNGPNKGSGPVTNAVWNFIHTWMNDVGQYHAGLYKGFTNGVTGSSSPLDTESSNYANTVGDLKITDNTNKDNISVKTYNRDGREYIRIGPFNWSFSGTITGVSALDQNGQNIDGLIYSSFNGNNEYWYGVGDIKSGRDFYVSVPADTGVTKITKITEDKGKFKIYITNDLEVREHVTLYNSKLKVEKGQMVEAGDALTEGSVAPKELLAVTDPITVQQYIVKENNSPVTYLPFYGYAQCGYNDILQESNVKDYIPLPTAFLPPITNNLFLIKTKGDSMYPTIKEDSLVLFRKNTNNGIPKQGQIVLAYYSEGLKIKRFDKYTESGHTSYRLISDNKQHFEPIPLDTADENIQIVGIYAGVIDIGKEIK